MNKPKDTFYPDPCNDFYEFLDKAKKLRQRNKELWIFRGQRIFKDPNNTECCLQTSFERVCNRFKVPAEKRRLVEQNIIREFRRRLHQYTTHIPDEDDNDELMALMQHHGAPTRLLDFTYSPYVAAYFAFEYADAGSNSNVAIWAINASWCTEQLEKQYPDLKKPYESYVKTRKREDFKRIFMPDRNIRKLVLSVNPFRLNERLAYQKGVFLCPGDVRVPFMDNLSDFVGNDKMENKVVKFTIPTGDEGELRNDALNSLELMNINRITLFPGLDGFAQSFSTRIFTVILPQGKH